MRLLIIRFGPLETNVAVKLPKQYFDIGGEDEVNNFYTKIRKKSAVRFSKGVGWIHLDMAYLERSILEELRYRHEGSDKFNNRGIHVAVEKQRMEREIMLRQSLDEDDADLGSEFRRTK